MQYCEKCKITVRGLEENCPLCQGRLSEAVPDSSIYGLGDTEDKTPMYPKVKKPGRKFWIFFRILTMICVSIAVVAVMLDLMMPEVETWTFFVLAGILCLWLVLNLAIYKRHIIVKNITLEAILLVTMCLVWDTMMGQRGWAIDFVLPIGSMCATFMIWIIATVKKLPASDYLICLLVMDLLGILPLLLYYLGKVGVIYPSLIASGSSIIFLCFLLFFEGKTIVLELQKRLHI